MLELAPDGMLMADADGVILAVKQQVERLFSSGLVEATVQSSPSKSASAHFTMTRASPSWHPFEM
jgi:hypothetical protein